MSLKEEYNYQYLYGLAQMAFSFFTLLQNPNKDVHETLIRSRKALREKETEELFLAYGYILTFNTHDGRDKSKNKISLDFLNRVLKIGGN